MTEQQAVYGIDDPEALDRDHPEEAIAEAAKAYSNWGRWGADDVKGTLNLIDEACRIRAAALIRRGVTFSLSLPFDNNGPQNGRRRRTNPVHSMLATGSDAAMGVQGFPHGFGGADDIVSLPLQCSTQWDGLGHIFDHAVAWNGRPAQEVVTADGDQVTGVEKIADVVVGRGVLLDVGRVFGDSTGELPDGFAITARHLDATAAAQGPSSRVGRGDLLCVRTGKMARGKREGWGNYTAGDAPGLSFTTAGWLHRTEVAAIATDTWGFEVRPNEFRDSFQPLHQVCIPNMGLLIGEIWDFDRLAEDCAEDGVYEFWLTAAPIPFTGAVGSPVNPIAVK